MKYTLVSSFISRITVVRIKLIWFPVHSYIYDARYLCINRVLKFLHENSPHKIFNIISNEHVAQDACFYDFLKLIFSILILVAALLWLFQKYNN